VPRSFANVISRGFADYFAAGKIGIIRRAIKRGKMNERRTNPQWRKGANELRWLQVQLPEPKPTASGISEHQLVRAAVPDLQTCCPGCRAGNAAHLSTCSRRARGWRSTSHEPHALQCSPLPPTYHTSATARERADTMRSNTKMHWGSPSHHQQPFFHKTPT